MSLARSLRLVALVSFLLAVLAVPGALAAQSRSFGLTVAITGKGTVRVAGRQLVCAATCKRTVIIRAGSRITLTTQPGIGWKFGTWAGACRGTATMCKVRMTRAARVGAKFIAPGAQANPIPLGTAAAVGKDWLMKVTAATANANAQVLAVRDDYGYPFNETPPAGAQYSMVVLSLTYKGGGSASLFDFVDSLETLGAHNVAYRSRLSGCPKPSLAGYAVSIYSGQSVAGSVCYLVASNDADSLMLSASDYPVKVWYALR